jgi:carbonic anhydrase
VVVVGHTQCGGAAACLSAALAEQSAPATPEKPLGRWLTPLTSLASTIRNRTPTPTASEALSALVEENVKAQVENVCKAPTVLSTWAAPVNGTPRKTLWVHGWVYEIEKGRLKDLEVSKGPPRLDAL